MEDDVPLLSNKPWGLREKEKKEKLSLLREVSELDMTYSKRKDSKRKEM